MRRSALASVRARSQATASAIRERRRKALRSPALARRLRMSWSISAGSPSISLVPFMRDAHLRASSVPLPSWAFPFLGKRPLPRGTVLCVVDCDRRRPASGAGRDGRLRCRRCTHTHTPPDHVTRGNRGRTRVERWRGHGRCTDCSIPPCSVLSRSKSGSDLVATRKGRMKKDRRCEGGGGERGTW